VCLEQTQLVELNVTAGADGGAVIVRVPRGTTLATELTSLELDNGDLDVVGLTSTRVESVLSSAFGILSPGATDILGVSRCDGKSSLVAVLTGNRLKLVDVDGVEIRTIVLGGMSPKLKSSGCVTQLTDDGTVVRQVVVVETTAMSTVLTRNTFAFFDDGTPGGGRVSLPLDGGVGFTGGSEPHMVIPLIDATGVVLVETVLLQDRAQTGYRLVQRSRFPSAAQPVAIESGRLDAGDSRDLVWLVATAQRDFSLIQLAYAREIDDTRLAALSSQAVFDQRGFFVTELTGDAFDDIAFVTRTNTTEADVTVVPTHVPFGAESRVDVACTQR
jgi:hypothetical protein